MEINEYILGVFAAAAAGITFNLGMLIQKAAVRKQNPAQGLVRQMLRSPQWLAGTALQFVVGSPLNMLALALVGPAVLPGLSSIGLVVLAVGAVRYERETLTRPDIYGIILIMAGTALIGFSRLEVDMIDLYHPSFLISLPVFSTLVTALSVVIHSLQPLSVQSRGVLQILNSGLFFVLTNLWLSVLIGFLAGWELGRVTGQNVALAGSAFVLTFVFSLLGMIEMQRAFQVGDASRLIPVQQVPVQVLSLVSYFAVFQLKPPGPAALPFALSAVALILVGSVLLSRRQSS